MNSSAIEQSVLGLPEPERAHLLLDSLDAPSSTDIQNTVELVCASPDRSRIVLAPDIRRAMFKVFHFDLVYREVDGLVQVLAIAHHRRQPGYWVARL
jgi:hypothetical protein